MSYESLVAGLSLPKSAYVARNALLADEITDFVGRGEAFTRVPFHVTKFHGPEPGSAAIVLNAAMSIIRAPGNEVLEKLCNLPQQPVVEYFRHCDFNALGPEMEFECRADNTIHVHQTQDESFWLAQDAKTKFAVARELGKRVYDCLDVLLNKGEQANFYQISGEHGVNKTERCRRQVGLLFAVNLIDRNTCSQLRSQFRSHFDEKLRVVRGAMRHLGWK